MYSARRFRIQHLETHLLQLYIYCLLLVSKTIALSLSYITTLWEAKIGGTLGPSTLQTCGGKRQNNYFISV